MARPTKFKIQYCDMLVKHMSEGYSFDTFAGRIKVNPDTLYEWLKHKKYAAFSEAKKVGTAQRNFRVEQLYMSAATGRPIKMKDEDGVTHILKPNPAMMIYWTKNTLGWGERIEHSVDGKSNTINLKYNIEE